MIMNDEEKQIEGMARKICIFTYHWERYKTCKECFEANEYACQSYRNCKAFIEEGYRKIDKDSVVLTKEEYEKLKQYEEKVKSGACFTQKEWLELCDEECKRNTENLLKVRQLERKETAREILDLLVPDCKVCDENWHSGCLCLRATLAEKIAKQYGVEIGEYETLYNE